LFQLSGKRLTCDKNVITAAAGRGLPSRMRYSATNSSTDNMTLDWSMDHGRRRVVAMLRRSTTEEDIYRFPGVVIAEGAMPYGKILDASEATKWVTHNRIGPLVATARLYARMGLGAVGPLAIVVSDEKGKVRACEFARLGDASRAVRVFTTRDEAQAWLDEGPSRSTHSQ